MKKILEIKVSAFVNATSTKPETVNLFDWLKASNNKSLVDKIRNETDSEKRNELKKALPCITPSGVFRKRAVKDLVEHSGLICIDIDRKANMDVDNFSEMKRLIKDLDCVAYCSLSVSGDGYFVLIPITYPARHKEHFESLKLDFNSCGITIDNSCSDVSRLRFASYDEEPYFNPEAKPYNKIIPNKLFEVKHINAGMNNIVTHNNVEKLIAEIEDKRIDITGGYKDWFAIGCSIVKEFGEDGGEYFHRVSRFHSEYSIEGTDKQYSACFTYKDEENLYNIETLFWYAKKHGLSGSSPEEDFPETTE